MPELGPSKRANDAYGLDDDDEPAARKPRHKRARVSDDESWSDPKFRTKDNKRKDDNKVKINLSAIGVKQKPKEPEKPVEVAPEQVKRQPEPQFRFNLPEKAVNPMGQTPPAPPRKEPAPFTPNSFGHPEAGPTGHENPASSGFMYRPYAFSPSSFGQNRSPGVSPNMVPMYSPMMFRPPNESYREYPSRNIGNVANTPSLLGQTPNINRHDTPLHEYGMLGVSPGGFTPLRTNFQKNSPMFSPGGMDGGNYFNPSPNVNNFSSTSFGYRRTPLNTYSRPGPIFQGGANPMPTPRGQGGQPNDSDRIFELNPFGS